MTTPAWLQNLHTIIFDLDGTLYQDHSFTPRYIAHLTRGTEHEARLDELCETAANIFAGRHPLGMDDWYDAERDLCVVHDGERAVSVCHWDGRPVEWAAGGMPAAYTDSGLWAEEAAARRLLFAGDAWSVVGIIAARLRVPEETRMRAFRQVREEMLKPPHAMHKHERLHSLLRRLPCRAMLLTNSPGESAGAFRQYLSLDGIFAYVAHGCGKPAGIGALIERITQEEGLPASGILSIGDHAWNDLVPARQAGCRTIAINPYLPADAPHGWNARIRTLDELADLLEQLPLKAEQSISSSTGG